MTRKQIKKALKLMSKLNKLEQNFANGLFADVRDEEYRAEIMKIETKLEELGVMDGRGQFMCGLPMEVETAMENYYC